MKIILTGASGFIGNNLLNLFISIGFYTLALGRNFTNPIKDSPYVAYQRLDLTNGDVTKKVLENLSDTSFDVFIHAAGQAHIAQTLETYDQFVNNNVLATTNALLLANKMGCQRFIFISSIATVGDSDDIYADSKRQAEHLVKEFCANHSMTYSIIRPVVVYGEGDIKGNMYKLIRQLSRGLFPLFKKGNNRKDILYIGNLCEVIIRILKLSDWDNMELNVCNKETLTLRQICDIICKALQKRCIFISMPTIVLKLSIIILRLIQYFGMLSNLNVKSIKTLAVEHNAKIDTNSDLLEKLPFTSEEGLIRTIEWYKTIDH